jgi:hypothetical protein
MASRISSLGLILVSLVFSVAPALADGPTFDLTGPKVDVRVTRAGKILPIAQVPSLASGDKLWIHADLPDSQSARYLLIVAFLRGSTNPPPETWFTRVETWRQPARSEGTYITVPAEAQQAIVFLAPETGGDFSTLRSAVRGRPGAFVRASQDLNQASLDRTRLEKYLAAIRDNADTDPKELQERTTLMARSLNMKVDKDCFGKPPEQQITCLTHNTESLVLDDAHSQSMVSTLANGPASDLVGQLSYSPMGGAGFYSAYVGAVVDTVRILDNLHTAQYQYIPALALSDRDTLNLRLNNPPSFKNPKSVIVVGLPSVDKAPDPPLRAVHQEHVYCAESPSLVLQTEGAPLVFVGSRAYDFTLQLKAKDGTSLSLPAVPDGARGGFVIDSTRLKGVALSTELTATLYGHWGFETFTGPSYHLVSSQPQNWTIASTDNTALVVGREDALHLQAEQTACVKDVTFRDSEGKEFKATWKTPKASELEVQVDLKNAPPGKASLLVHRLGGEPDSIPLHTYAEAGHLDRFELHAGEHQGVLTGTRLDEVATLDLNGTRFDPAGLTRADEKDELKLSSGNATAVAEQQPDLNLTAQVTLKDGRSLKIPAAIEPPRPKVSILTKSIQPGSSPASSIVHLANPDELPQDGHLAFALKTEVPTSFSRTEQIEVATADDSFHTLLSLDQGDLILQDAQNVLVNFEPLAKFGPSAFGPLKFRPVDANGNNGEWQPLVQLVRIPLLTSLRCKPDTDSPCALTGSNLFLLEEVAAKADFSNPVTIPVGFVDSHVMIPHPPLSKIFIRLRDDPASINTAVLPVLPMNPQTAATPAITAVPTVSQP